MNTRAYLNIICSIMNCTLNNQNINIKKYEDDSIFFEIMKEQTFLPFLYYTTKLPKWKKFYYQSFLINEKFNKLGEKLIRILNENKIDHMFFKGYIIKELYPQPFLRQMGDIDILVREKDYSTVLKILINNGFIFESEEEYHTSLKIDGLNIEIHNKLLSKNNPHYTFFKKTFDIFSNKVNNHTYKMDDTIHLLYLLSHYLKHLKQGAGLRALCDIYLYLSNVKINEAIFFKHLKELNMDAFFNTILNQLDYIFGYNYFKYTKNSYFIELLEYSLKSGIHGFGKENQMILNEYHTYKKSKLSFLLSKVFIPIPKLFSQYPWTKSIILIPLGYIFRFFSLLKNKNKQLKEILQISKKDEMFNKTGINN